jgi:uncharacterized LabA/DUF88 family protein
LTLSDRLRLAVFIDFDNIEIGVKNTLNATFDAGLVLEALKERGDVVSKCAYSDWQRAAGFSRGLSQHAIRMVQRNMTPGGDKNGADINLALDALEMAFTHPHINAFVIVAGDSDFISLVEKLKQYDKKVFVVGGRQFTSGILQRNCHEFIAYENLVNSGVAHASGGGHRRERGREGRAGGSSMERTPIEQAIPLVTRGLQVLSEREVDPQLGLLKSTLLQLDSTFSERSYGAGSFRDFAQKLADLGVVRLTQSKGGWLVTPADGGEPRPQEAAPAAADASAATAATPAPAVTGSQADGVREFMRILSSGNVRRWPLYLRNLKSILREATPPFDGRAYGFESPMDLLRAAQREGLVRVDRDRQGVIRVFQGTPAPAAPADDAMPPVESAVSAAAPQPDPEPPQDAEVPELEPGDNIGNVAADVAPPAAAKAPRRRSPSRANNAMPASRRRRPKTT